MTNELYFIAMIERALSSDAPQKNLITAFNEIESLGKTQEFSEGFKNFQLFMKEIIATAEKRPTSSLQDDSIKQEIGKIREIYRELVEQENVIPEMYEFIIRYENQLIHTIQLKERIQYAEIENADPGFYSIELSSGQVIWKKELDHTILTYKNPPTDDYFTLAAQTENPSYEESLLGGDLIIQVIPGEYQGKIRITLSREKCP